MYNFAVSPQSKVKLTMLKDFVKPSDIPPDFVSAVTALGKDC